MHFKEFGDTESVCHECSLGVHLVIDDCVYVPSDALPLYQFFKAIGQLVMEILHLKDLGDTESVRHKCSVCVNLVIDNFFCRFRYFTSVSKC